MKQTLPWNVTGIPPEARELARSAAARDGLSVGDWLTKRIYTQSAQDAQEPQIEPPARNYRDNRDGEARRDREELMHRLARTEAETESAFRRIDETLRALGRRLETTEHSQNDAKLSVHTAATELNAVTREQAQNFNILERRLEKVEQAADTSALRAAVRGLHQGVSRLAEQVAKSANDSSVRIESLARSIDAVSESAQATRTESTHLAKDIGERINALTEKLAQSEERLDGVETRFQEALGRHTSSAEERFEEIAERLDQVERSKGEDTNKFEEAVKGLTERLDASDKHNQEALSEYRLSLEKMRRRLDSMDAAPIGFVPRGHASDTQSSSEFATPGAAPPPAFEAEPFAPEPAETDTVAPTPFVRGADSVADADTHLGPLEDSSFDLPPFPDDEPDLDESDMAELSPEPNSEFDYPTTDHESPLDLDGMENEFEVGDGTSQPADVARDYLADARRAASAAAQPEPRKAGLGLANGRLGQGINTSERARTELRRPPLAVAAGLLLLVGVGYLVLSSGLSPFTNEIVSVQATLPPAANASETDFAVLPPIEGPYSAAEEGTLTPDGALTTLPNAVNQAPTYSSNIDQYASLNAPSAPNLTIAPSSPPAEAPSTSPAPPPSAPTPNTPAPSTPAPVANNQAGNGQAVTSQPVSGPALSTPQSPATNNPSPLERLLSQARGGSPAAALLVGLKYLEGDGVTVSDSEGARWLRTAAELGEPVAQYRLGSIFERGRGVPADASQAAFWYEQAARSGNRKAMHNLAVAYADGLGIERNLAEAARWFRSAADLGLTDSQFNLAVLHERGLGVPSSLNEAFKWYSIAANQGDAEARSRVEVLTTQLPEDQRLTAERAAAAYAPQPLDQAANEPPTLAQIQ